MTPTSPLPPSGSEPGAPTRPIYVDLRPKDPFHPAPRILVRNWRSLGQSLFTSFKFLFETEVHVYAFAVAVNILISFYPFLVAMILICRRVLHWPAAVDVLIRAASSYFPDNFGFPAAKYLWASSWKSFSWLSLFLLFFTANGIFTPLEVAFNRIWRAKGNRSFITNQIIGLALIFVCGVLVVGSVSFTTLNAQLLGSPSDSGLAGVLQSILFHVAALPVMVLMIFLVYWLLPNAKIPVGRLLLPSVAVAMLLQISEYVDQWTWPWLRDKLRADVPPFVQSIAIIFWAFIATLIVLAGAEWAARVKVEKSDSDTQPLDRQEQRG